MESHLPAARRLCTALLASILLITACSDSSDNSGGENGPGPEPGPGPGESYRAEVVWTEYGIPHVTADNWSGLGYGYGYAYARENFCVLMKEVVRANGESARYLGDEGNLQEDFVYKLYNTDEYILEEFAKNEDFAALLKGFTAGVNRYLAETGADALAEGEEGCRGAEWVRELNDTDLGKLLRKLILRASTDPLAEYIAAQDGPDDPMVVAARRQQRERELLAPARFQLANNGAENILPKPEELGSNAYAVGSNLSTNGSGLLFGNPHFPWQGSNRFFMVHLTIPGTYDAMGASLHGFPLVNVGFNEDVAWSHTVSTASRFTLYELTLDDNDPMKYVYDGELRDIETATVTAESKLDNGDIETVEHTFYLSHYGPILDLSEPTGVDLLGGWPTQLNTIYAVRDVNLYNSRGFDTWAGMGMATSLAELVEAAALMGNPWTNTIAADRHGNALYGDISTTPNVTAEQYETCTAGFPKSDLTGFGLPTLDGSTSECEWGNDGDAPVDGILGLGNMPRLETRDYAGNANDSYWLSNPDQLLTGFSPIVGREEVEQSRRTRATFTQAEDRKAGTDGFGPPGFDVDNLRQMSFQAKNFTADLVLDDVLTVCDAMEEDPLAGISQVEIACDVLAGWDRSHRIDSVGGHVFFEFWREMRGSLVWQVDFDATDPVNTPRDLDITDPAVVTAVEEALATAVEVLSAAGIPLDRAWGDLQFDEKNGERIPIHGGSGDMMFSVISSDLVEGEGYADITHGNSYMQTVGWDGSACPDAFAILTYSQSTDPASPHYADATKLYSESGWIDMPYCEADRNAQEIGRMTISE